MAERDRHLAAVWFADIVGYTQLSNKNEDAAFGLVDLLQQRARAVIDEQGGRLVKCIGDAVLAEFRSTEGAVRAALALRDGFASDSRDSGYPAQLRIGLHLGDLRLAPDGDVYGDGVNTASRLQGLAEPGQIVVSQDVWRQLRPRAEYVMISLGERRLKGIAGAVWAFSVDRRPEGATADARGAEELPHTPLSRRLLGLARTGPLYVAASVAVIGVFHLLGAALDLPEWVTPVVVVLLAVGFVVMLVTAWAESRPAWRQSLTARPRTWDVGMADLTDSLSRRRFPEMTWPRALWGGVAVFTLVLGAALAQRWVEQGPSTLLRTQVAHAAPSPSVVILPFTVEGAADELWGEGLVDLMALSVDASRQLRVVGARSVIRRLPEPTSELAPDGLYALGDDLGARYAIMGRLVVTDEVITLQADVYDVHLRQWLGIAEASGSTDRIANHVDLLASRALAFTNEAETPLASRPPLSRLATRSVPALQAYLRGEQLYRRSRLSNAREAFAEAVERDPTFALARYRLALTEAWNELPHHPRVSTHQIEAERHVARLAERDSLLITGFGQLNRGNPTALQTLTHLVGRFPDDAEGWFLLGDARYHLGQAGQRAAAADALREAVRLDPGYGPAYVHLIDAAVEARDTTQVRQWLMAYRRVDPGSPLLSGFEWALQLARTAGPPAPGPARPTGRARRHRAGRTALGTRHARRRPALSRNRGARVLWSHRPPRCLSAWTRWRGRYSGAHRRPVSIRAPYARPVPGRRRRNRPTQRTSSRRPRRITAARSACLQPRVWLPIPSPRRPRERTRRRVHRKRRPRTAPRSWTS
jgi:class 3 adenylate cyclase/tetratricopeptide (TPR) repeat protein